MYNELVKTDQELKTLEKQLNDLLSAERDSLAAWESYLSSIDNYYAYAFHRVDTGMAPSLVYAPRIEDPDLRAHLRSVLDASKARHTARMGGHDALVASLEKERLLLEDRHEALKVMLTLAVIEAYQLENMPSLDGLKAVDKQQKAAKAALEARLKKAGF
jgi:hypothetical protein